MITITLHTVSIAVGLILGYVVSASLFLCMEFHDGGRFDQGWKAGCEYGRKSERERIEKEGDQDG